MARKKQPEEHLELVRHKILDTAKALFVQQGYKKTTIRQIVEHSGILTGSIYYLFKNKEDIFQALILELTRACIDTIEDHFQQETPAFKYAALCVVELKAVAANKLVRETFYEGYTSNVLFERMVEHQTNMAARLFGKRYTIEEYYRKTLLIKGAMRSCIAAFYFQRQTDSEADWKELLYMALAMFEVSADDIEQIVRRVCQMEDYWLEIGNTLRDSSGAV